MVALYRLVFRGFGFARIGTLTSQAAYSYTYISQDRKGDEKCSFLAPFYHALLPSVDLRLQTRKLCHVKAFPRCHLSYFWPSPWAYACLCCLFIKPQQPWDWFGAMLWVILKYVWAQSATFLFCMRFTGVLWKLFTQLSCIWKRDQAGEEKKITTGHINVSHVSEVDMQHPLIVVSSSGIGLISCDYGHLNGNVCCSSFYFHWIEKLESVWAPYLAAC